MELHRGTQARSAAAPVPAGQEERALGAALPVVTPLLRALQGPRHPQDTDSATQPVPAVSQGPGVTEPRQGSYGPHSHPTPPVPPNCVTSVQRLSPRAEESRPAPPQLPALLSCLHPICFLSPVNLTGCHVACELQGTGMSALCFSPPRAQTRRIGASGPSPALRGRGASHTRCRQDPGRLCVLPACGDRSRKRPGRETPGGCRGSCGKGDRKPSVHVSRVTWMEPGLWG